MIRTLSIAVCSLFAIAGSAFAWNRAGHMVMGAIAFDDLQRSHPAALARATAILRQHPQYESRWKPQLNGMSEEDQGRFLFMLAARWPDDVRGDRTFDHPLWHYINYPYRPKGQPDSFTAPPPAAENIVQAFRQNIAIFKGSAPDDQKAVALCWIFHLLGDSHQPLHTIALFTAEFPEGDRGGNLFFIRADPAGPTENLHAYWDGILITDDGYDPARMLAANIENSRNRAASDKSAESHFEKWTHDSFDLAVSKVYRKGKLKISTDKNAGTVLPRNYHAEGQRAATRQIALSADRLAAFLESAFP